MNVNRKNTILAAGLLALAVVAETRFALAQESPNIAVVDVQYLLQHSAAAKNALAQSEKMFAEYQKEIDGKLDGIAKAYESLIQERSNLSEDVYQRRLLGLRQRTESDQRAVQQTQGKLDGARRHALQKIRDTIEQVVDQIIKEQKLTVVLPRSAIIGTPAVADITQEVLRRLDQRMPPVAIDKPK